MTEVSLYKNKNGKIVKFVVDGHTDFADIGSDVLCAAVSTAATMTLNGITEVAGICVGFEVRDAYIECVLPDNLSKSEQEKCELLINTMMLALHDLEQQYEKHITITELEV